VDVFEVGGPFLMGTLHKYEETMRVVAKKPKARIIILRKVSFLDPSDFYLFEMFCRKCWKDGIKLVLLGVRSQPLDLIKKTGLYDTIGPQNICKSFEQALKRTDG
jgi:SulP family sulfate permease